MNISSNLYRPAAAALAAGGLCWVLKFVVIAATDGATSGAADTLAAVLYLTAVALMVLGLAAVGVALLEGRHPMLRALGGLAGVVAWWLTYLLIEIISQAAAGDSGPSWLADEVGIVATGAVLMMIGLLLARSRPTRVSGGASA